MWYVGNNRFFSADISTHKNYLIFNNINFKNITLAKKKYLLVFV